MARRETSHTSYSISGWEMDVPGPGDGPYVLRRGVTVNPASPRESSPGSAAPELEQVVNDKVRTGMYQTASEVIREGLRLLKELDQRLEALRRDIRAGFDAVERGEYADFEAATVREIGERVKLKGRKRLAGEKTDTK